MTSSSPISSTPDTKVPQVTVTAYGVTSCLGIGVEALRKALAENRSGLQEIPKLPPELGNIPFSACVGVIPELLQGAPLRDGFQATRQLDVAWQTAVQIDVAVRQTIQRWGHDRVGLILGTSTGAILATELALLSHHENGELPSDYSCEDGHAMDAAARYLAALWQITGPVFAVSAACASGAKALASAKRLIESGVCDAVVAGGIDSLCRMTIHGFHSLGVLSPQRCSPFDNTRFGMNVAEGGALLLLEKEHAESEAFGYLLGIGESSDAYHMSAPDPEGRGQSIAIKRALDDAGITSAEVDYLNAHGTGTQANDEAEALAVQAVLPGCPTSSTKGLTGHQLGAAGATEAVIALEVLRGLELGSGGCFNPELFPLKSQKRRRVQSNSFAFGGANISLVFGSSPGPANKHVEERPSIDTTYFGIERAVSSEEFLDSPEASWGEALLPARARARAGTLTRLCAELAARTGLSKVELGKTPVIVGSAFGQLQITRKLIGLFLAGDSSPLAFQNSVHNSVFGTLSLALSNREPSSSIAGGKNSFFYAFIEACTLLWSEPQIARVLVLCADETPPPELKLTHVRTAGAAFVITREPTNSIARLELRRDVPEAHFLPHFQTNATHEQLHQQAFSLTAHLKSNAASPIAICAENYPHHLLITPQAFSPTETLR